MAKWGEGDPRWIVEERPDAINVNNWHWTEKNATSWSKDKFHQLFKNFIIDDKNIKCTVEGVEKCLGEATANNRKGKLIFFYEWDLLLKWKGTLSSSNSPLYTGKISIPNLSEENHINEIEITVTVDESNETSEILKQFMYNVGRERIRQLVSSYITELKEEYSKNLILPIKSNNLTKKCEISASVNQCGARELLKSDMNPAPSTGCKQDERTIFIEEDFQCSANDLYNVLTKSSMIEAFTRGPVDIDASPGGEFRLYGGHVHGIFEELEPEKRITLRWRLKSWPLEHYSKVEIELEEMKNSTQLKLKQSGVPASEYDSVKANWYRYYWHSIKQTFGFGVLLTDVL